MRIFAAIVALRVSFTPFAASILYLDWRHSLVLDPRRASWRTVRNCKVICVAALVFLGLSIAAHARTSPYPGVTQFTADRYSASAQMGADVANALKRQRAAKKLNRRATAAHRKRPPVSRKHWDGHPMPKPRPGTVERLSGVVAPLATKAREIVANCGSEVISGIRHTYIAGTGGRLSLHASGRAIDIKGNPGCIYSHLRGWPGGVSTDYGAVQHVHFSYAPGGSEWGMRFAHYRGGHRHKHRRHARR